MIGRKINHFDLLNNPPPLLESGGDCSVDPDKELISWKQSELIETPAHVLILVSSIRFLSKTLHFLHDILFSALSRTHLVINLVHVLIYCIVCKKKIYAYTVF